MEGKPNGKNDREALNRVIPADEICKRRNVFIGKIEVLEESQHSGIGQDAGNQKKWAAFVTPETGLAEIVEALQAHLKGVNMRLGTRVTKIAANEFADCQMKPAEAGSRDAAQPVLTGLIHQPSNSFDVRDGQAASYHVLLENGEALEAEAVILATPAYVTAQLVGDLDSDMAARARRGPL